MGEIEKFKLEIELAEKMMEKQLYVEALSIIDKLLEQTDNTEILYLRAKILFLSGKFHDVIENLTTLITKDSSFWKAYELLGEAHRCLNNFEVAENFYQKATELNPKSWTSWIGRGKIAYKMGDFHQAILCFT
ncbi:MAG: tetratricopeptide repeat protein, partial [Candidatus Heimdallarchaeaceae archaeon]